MPSLRRRFVSSGSTSESPIPSGASTRLCAEALAFVQHAVEELPGNDQLVTWETKVLAAEAAEIDLEALVLGLEPEAEDPAAGSQSFATSASEAPGAGGPGGQA